MEASLQMRRIVPTLQDEECLWYGFVLRGSREAAVQAEALEAKVLMCLRRLTRPRRERSHGVVSSSSGRERPR